MYHIDDIPFGAESVPDVYTQFRKVKTWFLFALPMNEMLRVLIMWINVVKCFAGRGIQVLGQGLLQVAYVAWTSAEREDGRSWWVGSHSFTWGYGVTWEKGRSLVFIFIIFMFLSTIAITDMI